jgi:hypothetical protein
MADKGGSSIVWLAVLAVGGYVIYSNWASIAATFGFTTSVAASTPVPVSTTTGTPASTSQPAAPPASSTNSSAVSLSSGIWPAVLSAAQANSFYASQGQQLNGSQWNAIVGQVTGTTPGAIPGDPGTNMSLQAYANLLTAANMVPTPQPAINPVNAVLLQSCLANAGINPTAIAQCTAQYSGLSGLGLARQAPGGIPANLILGHRGFAPLPTGVFHRA